jgi:hypothetical protein
MPTDAEVLPLFKIEINGTDVTDYVVSNGVITPNAVDRVSGGNFFIHIDCPTTPKEFDDAYFYVYYTSYFKKFGGVISTVVKDESNFRYAIEVKNYDWLAYRSEYTGVFRADTGKGNIKTIITDIITEKLPGVTWDTSSFPAVDSSYDIIYKTYQDKKPGDIFDELAVATKRTWWIDKDRVFYFKERSFTFYNNPIEYGENIIGLPIIDRDTSNYANIVKVFGAKITKEVVDTFSATGTLDQFTLSYYPSAVRSIEYTSGTKVSFTLEGADNYNTGSYTSYLKPAVPAIKFNTVTSSGSNNIKVYYSVTDQIKEEFAYGAAIEEAGFEVVKRIDNQDISSQDEAFLIAKAEAESSVAIDIVTANIKIENQDDVEQYSIGNSIPVSISSIDEAMDILEEQWSFSKSTGLNCRLRLNGSRKTSNDVLIDFLKRIKQRDDKENLSRSINIRYFYWGGNIYTELSKLSVEKQVTDEDAFELQEVSQDYRSLMQETTGTVVMKEAYVSYEPGLILSHNQDNTYVENFLDDWYIDDRNSYLNSILYLDLETNPVASTVGDVSASDDDATLYITATAYYPFNGDADDESTNSNNGTVTGATLTTDHLGTASNAYAFVSPNDFISITNPITGYPFSVSGWFKLTNSADTPTLFSMSGGASIYYAAYVSTGGFLGIAARNTTSRTHQGSTDVRDGIWHHFAAVFTSATDRRIYLDGVEQGTQNTNSVTFNAGTTTLYFGRLRTTDTVNMLTGDLDDVMVFSSSLSQAQIDNLITATEVHKLDKPLTTLSTLTGYEFNGRQYITGPGMNTIFGAGAAGNKTSTYIEFVLKSYPQTSNCLLGNGSNARIQISNTGQIIIDDWASTSAYDVSSSTGVVSLNTKYKLLVTCDTSISSNNLNLYLDGNLLTSNSIAAATAAFGATTYIGSYDTTLTNAVDGIIAQPRIFRRILSSYERDQLFAGTLDGETLYSTTF